MRLRPSLALLSCFLVSCGGGGGDIACTQEYWNGSIGTCIPDGWQVLEGEALAERGVPEEVVVAFQSEDSVSGQLPTITVTGEALPRDMESAEYSEASVQSVATLPGYELIDERDVSIDGEDVSMHIFSAQPRADEPKVRFYQLSIAAGQTGYTYTAATPLAVSDTLDAQIELILENATLTEPTEEE